MAEPNWFTQEPVQLRETTVEEIDAPVELQLPSTGTQATTSSPTTNARQQNLPPTTTNAQPLPPATANVAPVPLPSQTTPKVSPRLAPMPDRSTALPSRSFQRPLQRNLALDQAATILGALPSIRFVIYEGDQATQVQREWATLYDYYIELFCVRTAVPTVSQLNSLIEQLRGSPPGLALLETQLINTLQQLSAELNLAIETEHQSNNWLARLFGRQGEDVDSMNLTLSSVESALSRLCSNDNQAQACKLRRIKKA